MLEHKRRYIVSPLTAQSPSLSNRAVGEVLHGHDVATSLIQACTTNDITNLRSMLSDNTWTKAALERPRRIYAVLDMDNGDDPEALARPRLNLEYLLEVSAQLGHLNCVNILLTWASAQKIDLKMLVDRPVVIAAIKGGNGEVFDALASAEPEVVHHDLGHGLAPIMEALLTGRPGIVDSLLKHGASLASENDTDGAGPREKGAALISAAAQSNNAQIAESLLVNGAAWRSSGALHQAAAKGSTDLMEVLHRHGADLEELLRPNPEYGEPSELTSTWTPMHYAASKNQVAAMSWLKERGASPEAQDKNGNTPASLLPSSSASTTFPTHNE